LVSLPREKTVDNEIGWEESGEHMIFIGSINHKPISFLLTVKIAKLADHFVSNSPDKLKEKEITLD
jgi:hypothetical protein